MSDPADVLAKASSLQRVPTSGERLFGIGTKANVLDMLGDFLTMGAFSGKPIEPTPANALMLMLMGGGLAKGAGTAWRSINTEPVLAPLSADKYGLSQAPMDRRNFFYRASGAPKKLAETRVGASPGILTELTSQLNNIGTAPGTGLKMRGEIFKKVEDEAGLVQALQDKYGMLNDNPVLNSQTSYGKPVNRVEVRPSAGWGTPNSPAGKSVSDLTSNIGDSTRRRLKDKLDLLARTAPSTGKPKITFEGLDPGLAEKNDSLNAAIRDVYNKYDREIQNIRRQMIKEAGPRPPYAAYGDPDFEAKRRASVEWSNKVFDGPKVKELEAERNKILYPLYSQFTETNNRLHKMRLAAIDAAPVKPLTVTPSEFMDDAIKSFHKRIDEIEAGPPKGFRNQSINQSGKLSKAEALAQGKTTWRNRRRTPEEINALWSQQRGIAEDTLRKQAAQFGGIEGQAMKDLAEAVIAGRPLVDEAQSKVRSAINNLIESRTGVRIQPVLDIADQAKAVADSVPTPAKVMNDVVKGLLKRFGLPTK